MLPLKLPFTAPAPLEWSLLLPVADHVCSAELPFECAPFECALLALPGGETPQVSSPPSSLAPLESATGDVRTSGAERTSPVLISSFFAGLSPQTRRQSVCWSQRNCRQRSATLESSRRRSHEAQACMSKPESFLAGKEIQCQEGTKLKRLF